VEAVVEKMEEVDDDEPAMVADSKLDEKPKRQKPQSPKVV
jgi:hypothetical protein